jgi:hypothetical protein
MKSCRAEQDACRVVMRKGTDEEQPVVSEEEQESGDK